MTGKMPDAIQAEGLVKRYGAVTALDGATADIPSGGTALIGANGAGKTTLLKIVMGLLRPDAGRCAVLGLDPLRRGKEIRRQIGFVPEDDAYWEGLSAVGAVQYAGRLCGIPSKEALKKAHRLLDEAGMGEERYRLMETFSMGMRQKVRLAQAMVHSPRMLILDEPTRFLDPSARREFAEWAQRLLKSGVSILISTHEVADIERFCDRAVVMAAGKVRANLDLKEILNASSEWEIQAQTEEDLEKILKAIDQLSTEKSTNTHTINLKIKEEDCTKIVKDFSLRKIKARSIIRKCPTLSEILSSHLKTHS